MNGLALPISESSQVADARRRVVALAQRLGFGDTQAGKVALVVTEIARNVLVHTAGGGMLLVRAIESGGTMGVEVLAVDRGPGMANPAECLRDGYSTAGTSGTGLGAVVRLSEGFDVFSLPGSGTALVARLWAGPRAPACPGLEWGGLVVAQAGEEVAGDGWGAECGKDGRVHLMLCDGLGHGADAAEVSRQATVVFRANDGRPPGELMHLLHEGLKKTRGGAIAVAAVDPSQGTLRFCAIGNISAVLVTSGEQRHLTGYDGIVGHVARKIHEWSYEWPPDGVLIMHSDGCSTHWRLDRYPGLVAKDPAVIAGVLYRDFERGHDDVSVAVVKARGELAA